MQVVHSLGSLPAKASFSAVAVRSAAGPQAEGTRKGAQSRASAPQPPTGAVEAAAIARAARRAAQRVPVTAPCLPERRPSLGAQNPC